tara:strand:+ start:35 stop:529 length:495 start_codon:yes stop_codon:yes gene_type:complete
MIVNDKLNLSNILRSVKFRKKIEIKKIITYAYTVLLKTFSKFNEKYTVSFFFVINFKGYILIALFPKTRIIVIIKKIEPTTCVELRHSKIGGSKIFILLKNILAPNEVNPETVSKYESKKLEYPPSQNGNDITNGRIIQPSIENKIKLFVLKFFFLNFILKVIK